MLRLLLTACATLATSAVAASHTTSRSTASVSSDASTVSLSHLASTTNPPLLTAQLSIPDDDVYYNVLMTDADGNELGVRVDFLQPSVWFINAMAATDCDDPNYATTVTSGATASTDSDEMCYLYGAYTPMTTVTTTNGTVEVVYTETALWETAATTSIPYPNGIVAQGVQQSTNLSLGVVGDKHVQLDQFTFDLIDYTNVYAGGLGLARSDSAEGILDYLMLEGIIPGHGYSTYFGDYVNNGTGHLIFGAVNQLYYSGHFYQFPQIAYEGWSGDYPLPIVPLDSITLYNPVSDKSVDLYSNLSFAVMLDPRSSYSYLPWDSIIEFAMQTNAYFSGTLNRWIVRCSDLDQSEATVNFTFGPLTVPVPVSLMLTEAYYEDNYLYFFDDGPACFLTILPITDLGYATLGLPFLTQIYFAMDNDGGSVAMANKKLGVDVSYAEQLPGPAVNGTHKFVYSNETTDTVGYITSGSIPFATKVSNSHNVTMTFSAANMTNTEVLPSHFSAVVIQSGEIYVTVTDGTSTFVDATAASAPTPSSGAMALRHSVYETLVPLYILLVLGGVLGVCLA